MSGISYEAFIEKVDEHLKDYLSDEYKDWRIERKEILKVNQRLDCINIVPMDEAKRKAMGYMVNLYLNDYYRRITEGIRVEEVLEKISEDFEKHQSEGPTLPFDGDIMTKKDEIVLQVINTKRNREYLKLLPHRDFLDLSLICRIVVKDKFGNLCGSVVNYGLMKEMNLDEETLFDIALRQSKRLMPPELIALSSELCALTNEKHFLGASSMMYEDILDELGKKIESDYYVLPSSIHELMIVPIHVGPVEQMKEMVEDVNRTVVSDDEWLSDNVYIYSKKTKELQIAVGKMLN